MLPDHFWDDLLQYVEMGEVVPIVGQELLKDGHTTHCQLVAEKLASDLRIPRGDLPGGFTLDQVVNAYKPFREKRSLLYPRIRAALEKVDSPIPEPLRKLARIRTLRLFVSTTFDSLLVNALNEERYEGRPETIVLSFSPSHADDLDDQHLTDGASVVFHLFGRVSASPDYAVTEADRLEFIHSLQSHDGRPNRLLDELHQKHLLCLGNNFPDWFTRFFIRTVKCDRLWTLRDKTEIVADEQIQQDQRLALFLDQFSRETTLFTEGSSIDFVNLLYQKWSERQSPEIASAKTGPLGLGEAEDVATAMEPGHMFISYASEDLPAAQRLRDALRQAGLDVWFDQTRLGAGEVFEEKIRQNIRKCALFLPLISKNTQSAEPRFFRKEWHWANLRLPEFTGTQRPFILPIVVDDTRFDAARVPDEFRTLHMTEAPDGVPPEAFVTQVRAIIREVRKRGRAFA